MDISNGGTQPASVRPYGITMFASQASTRPVDAQAKAQGLPLASFDRQAQREKTPAYASLLWRIGSRPAITGEFEAGAAARMVRSSCTRPLPAVFAARRGARRLRSADYRHELARWMDASAIAFAQGACRKRTDVRENGLAAGRFATAGGVRSKGALDVAAGENPELRSISARMIPPAAVATRILPFIKVGGITEFLKSAGSRDTLGVNVCAIPPDVGPAFRDAAADVAAGRVFTRCSHEAPRLPVAAAHRCRCMARRVPQGPGLAINPLQ